VLDTMACQSHCILACRMVLRSTPPIFSFVLIFSNLFPISTGLFVHDAGLNAMSMPMMPH